MNITMLRPALILVVLGGACGSDNTMGLDLSGAGHDLAVPTTHDAAVAAHPDLTGTVGDAATSSDAPVATIDGGMPSPDLVAAGGCGTCPTGYTCGTANGLPTCRAASGVPLVKNVYLILMENTSKSTLDAATNTPYLKSLASTWATGSNYHGVVHPSLPNYIAITSGSPQGIGCDCAPTGSACTALTCNALVSLFVSCNCLQPSTVHNIADDIEAANLTWRAYAEDMGSACNLTSSGGYATRHVPFLYYSDISTNAARCSSSVVDYGKLAGDLAAPPNLVYIAPNLTHDMHDPFPATSTNLANGDTWLMQNVPAILTSQAFLADGLAIVVWDEDDLSGGLTGTDDAVPIFVMSPLAKQGGYVSAGKADHYALLATIEDALNLPRIGKAVGATPLSDYFPAK